MRLIDVDDLLNNLRKLKVLSLEEKDLFTGPARIAVYARIAEQPIITPESLVKHGKNITHMHPVDEFVCSECGIIIADCSGYNEEDDVCYEFEFKYCPNCGAKMDGGAESEL